MTATNCNRRSGEKPNSIADTVPPPAKKRGRKSTTAGQAPAKKIKLDFRHDRGTGHVLTLGQVQFQNRPMNFV